MIEVYYTKNEFVHRKAEILIGRKLGKGFEIKRNENGKPYVSGNPVYFSISHSAGRAMIALSDKPVGIDLEFYRPRKFEHILKRLSARERKWIDGNFIYFFLGWVSKEAYVKMKGGTLAQYLKRLEYFEYSLYCDGEKYEDTAVLADFAAGIYALCAEGSIEHTTKRFKLRKGEKL